MNEIRKVPASAGAEWLLTGFSLFNRAPLALGLLGIIWGVFLLLLMLLSVLLPLLSSTLQLLIVLANPLLMGGLLWAIREIDEGRTAHPSHLLQGFQNGRAPHLLLSVLPQLVASLVLGWLLLILVGPNGLQRLHEVMDKIKALKESGVAVDTAQIKQLAAGLPAKSILLWLLLVAATSAILTLAMFVVAPQVMFNQTTGPRAIRESLRASLHNLPAMLVFFVFAFIAMLAIYFAVTIVAMLALVVAGQIVAGCLTYLLLAAVPIPLLAGAIYAAWKQMFIQNGTPPLPRSDLFAA